MNTPQNKISLNNTETETEKTKKQITSCGYYTMNTPRNEMDIAVVGAGVSVSLDKSGTCKSARVALGAVAPTVMLLTEAANILIDSRLEDPDLNKLAALASNASRPITDKRGTSEFRKHVVGVLAKRAALAARDRVLAKLK